MTIQNTTLRKAGPSQGNGVTTVFPFTFKVFTATDILVTYLNALAVESVLVLSTNYTVSLNADQNTSPGGSVTLLVAPATATYITLTSQLANTQTLALTNSGGFYPESINNALDRTVIEIQQLAEKVSRTVSIPTSSTASVTLPIPAGGNVIGWNATATALTNLPAATGTSLVSLAASTGSTLVGTTNGGTGAVARTVASKINDIISVKDFGAVGDGVTDDTAAFLACVAALQTSNDYRGGTILIPTGVYIITSEIVCTAYAVGQVHNLYFEGEGPDNTVLNFSGALAGSNGISFNAGSHFGIKNLAITLAPANGIYIGKGNTVSGAYYCNFYSIENVRVQECGVSGLLSVNSYMGNYTNIWSKNNILHGFQFSGFHTSLNVSRCYSMTNTGIGFSINGVVYSNFDTCGSDYNTQQGWTVSNTCSSKFTACGAESNEKDGWYLFTSTSSAVGLPGASLNIHGLVFDACFGYQNSLSSAGSYATFISAVTADSRNMDFVITGGIAYPYSVSDRALIINGASGTITYYKQGVFYNGFTPEDLIVGVVIYKDATTLEDFSSGASIGFTASQNKGVLLASGVAQITTYITRKTTGSFSSLIEVSVDVQDTLVGYACYSRKYLFKFMYSATGGATVSAITTAADYSISQSSANYAMTITPSVVAVSSTIASFSLTATTSGSIPWATAKCAISVKNLANQPTKWS